MGKSLAKMKNTDASFTTGLPCIMPDAPQLISPPDGATGLTVPLTLSWNAAANAISVAYH